MPDLQILRTSYQPTQTFGVLFFNNLPFCMTLEPPWKNNEPHISCIPEGTYQARRIISPTFGETLEFLKVPCRTEIIFHVGNWAHDTRGCILLGEYTGKLNNIPALLDSTSAMNRFRLKIHNAKKYTISIRGLDDRRNESLDTGRENPGLEG